MTTTFDPVLVNATMQSISCGQPELYDVIVSQNEVMQNIACAAKCSANITFLSWQLMLIELAQAYVRNKVDVISQKAQMESTSLFASLGYRNSESQSTVQHRGCGWATATSFTGFRRDAQSTYRAVADKDGVIFGQTWSTGQDRGTKDASGYENSFSQHDVNEQNVTTRNNTVFTIGSHDRFRGNTPSGGGDTQTTQNALIAPPLKKPILDGFFEIPYQLEDRYNSGNWAVSGADGSFTACACDYNFRNFQYNFGQCIPNSGKKSISRSGLDRFKGDGTVSIGIGVAGLFGVSADLKWGTEQSFSSGFSQRYVENRHTDHEADLRFANSATDRWMENNLDANSTSHDQSVTRHNAHSNSQGFRDAASHVKEATSSVDTSDGETHTGADRQSHTERSLQGQSTGGGNAHSQSKTDASTESSTRLEATYWHQLSLALRQMWREVFQQREEMQAILNATTSPVSGKTVTRQSRGSSCYASSTLLPHKGKGSFNRTSVRYF